MNCRVLHSLPTWLPISENWIYPQVVDVPRVQSAVFCDQTNNISLFPMPTARLFIDQPPLIKALAGRSIARRILRWTAHGLSSALVVHRVTRWRPDLLHAHFGNRGCEMLPLASRLGIPLITSFYGYDAWQLPNTDTSFKSRLQGLFERGNVFLVEGPALGRRLEELGCPADRIILQRLGVDLIKFEFVERSFVPPLKIIMIGRFVEKKGFADGLRACAFAAAAGLDFRLTIVGDSAEGDLLGMEIKKELQSLASTVPLVGRVDLAGFVSPHALTELIRQQDVMLAPSRHARNGDAEGGLPVALIEAMAQGLVCIASDHCDIPELVIDEETGFLFAEGDVYGMAACLMKLQSASRLVEIAKKSRMHVRDRFDRDVQLSTLSNIYQELTRAT